MFFKMSVLKKMMKHAYKGGCLIVGDSPIKEDDEIAMDGLVISTGWWSLWINRDYVPKELKAAVIELCGELPYYEHWFKASESLGNQEMIPFTEATHPIDLYQKAKDGVNITKLLMTMRSDGVMRILQNNKTKQVSAINEMIMSLIDPGAIKDEDGEYPPIGPLTRENEYFAWGNNICYFIVYPIKPLDETRETEQKMFFEELAGLELPS